MLKKIKWIVTKLWIFINSRIVHVIAFIIFGVEISNEYRTASEEARAKEAASSKELEIKSLLLDRFSTTHSMTNSYSHQFCIGYLNRNKLELDYHLKRKINEDKNENSLCDIAHEMRISRAQMVSNSGWSGAVNSQSVAELTTRIEKLYTNKVLKSKAHQLSDFWTKLSEKRKKLLYDTISKAENTKTQEDMELIFAHAKDQCSTWHDNSEALFNEIVSLAFEELHPTRPLNSN